MPQKKPVKPADTDEKLLQMNEATTTVTARMPYSLKVELMNEAIGYNMNVSQWITYLVSTRKKFEEEKKRLEDQANEMSKKIRSSESALKKAKSDYAILQKAEKAVRKQWIDAQNEREDNRVVYRKKEEKLLNDIKKAQDDLRAARSTTSGNSQAHQKKVRELQAEIQEWMGFEKDAKSKVDKFKAEAEKFKAEADKFKAEAETLKARINKANSLPNLRYGGGFLEDSKPFKV